MDTPEAAENRYSEFIVAVSRTGRLWLLKNPEGLAVYSEDGTETIPIFSTPGAADACASLQFQGYVASEMALAEFTASVLPQLVARHIWLAANPTPELTGISVPASELFAGISVSPN